MNYEPLKNYVIKWHKEEDKNIKYKILYNNILPLIESIIDGVLFTLKIFQNHTLYKDIKQECFYKSYIIISNKKTIRNAQSLHSYLFIALKNTVLNFVNKEQRYRNLKKYFRMQILIQKNEKTI